MLPGHQQPSQSLLLLAWIPGIPFHNYLKTGHSVKLCIYISQNCIVGVCGFWKDYMLKFLYCWSYTMHASNLYQTFCSCNIFLTLYVQSAKADWRSPRKSGPHSSHHINQTICNVYTITQCWSLMLLASCLSCIGPIKHQGKWDITCCMLANLHRGVVQYLQLVAPASPLLSSLWTRLVVGTQTGWIRAELC